MVGATVRNVKGVGWPLAWFTAGVATVLLVVAVTGSRQGVAVIDLGPKPPEAAGTISGTIRGPESAAAIEGRRVEVVNVETAERQRTATNNAGGFTFRVKPGKYRVVLTLRDGEDLVKQPGVLHVNRSDVDARANFVIGSGRASVPRGKAASPDLGLGSPVA